MERVSRSPAPNPASGAAAAGAAPPRIEPFTLGPFATNCYVVSPAAAASGPKDPPPCWIVDASFEPAAMIDHVRAARLRPEAIVLTHAHIDHIAGIGAVRGAFPGVPIWIHEAEESWLEDPRANGSAAFGLPITAPPADRLLKHGDRLTLGPDAWLVLHTPGHSPGGITLWHEPSRTALVGDALFAGSIGRTDLAGGDFDQLAASIRNHLYTLPDTTRVLPGHGPETTISREKRSNPYVRG